MKSDEDNYEDLWKGNSKNIPEKYLNFTVGVVGAKQKDILDIELRR